MGISIIFRLKRGLEPGSVERALRDISEALGAAQRGGDVSELQT